MLTALSKSSIGRCWKINGISKACTSRRPPERSISRLCTEVLTQMSQHLSGNPNETHFYPPVNSPDKKGTCEQSSCMEFMRVTQWRWSPHSFKSEESGSLDMPWPCLMQEKNTSLWFPSQCHLNVKTYREKREIRFNATWISRYYTYTSAYVTMSNQLIKERQYLNSATRTL